MKRALISSVCVAVVAVLAACAGQTKIESDMGVKGAPDWVNEGTQAVSDKDGRLIQGVGMAPAMGDTSLQKGTADNRARAEIARVLSIYIDTTLSDYTASTGTEADADIMREIRGTTQLALSGSKILGHWKDEKTGDVYSFAELDLEVLEETLATATNLHQNFQEYYSENANAGFDRFVEEDLR